MVILKWMELTQKDFREMNREHCWCIIPISSIEQHGFHLPVGTDTLILKATLEAIKDKVDIDRTLLQLPQLYYGKSTEHTNYPGTITLEPETIHGLLYDITASLARHDFRNIIVVNSHGGNAGLLDGILYDLRMKYQVRAYGIHLSSVYRNTRDVAENEFPHSMHAGCMETSFMLHWYPELVKKDHIPKATLSGKGFEFLKKVSGKADWGWATEDITPQGYIGSPQLATAENGKAIVEDLSRGLVELIKTIIQGP
jgi:creatinine amidohydrolase